MELDRNVAASLSVLNPQNTVVLLDDGNNDPAKTPWIKHVDLATLAKKSTNFCWIQGEMILGKSPEFPAKKCWITAE